MIFFEQDKDCRRQVGRRVHGIPCWYLCFNHPAGQPEIPLWWSRGHGDRGKEKVKVGNVVRKFFWYDMHLIVFIGHHSPRFWKLLKRSCCGVLHLMVYSEQEINSYLMTLHLLKMLTTNNKSMTTYCIISTRRSRLKTAKDFMHR